MHWRDEDDSHSPFGHGGVRDIHYMVDSLFSVAFTRLC
jgi:hypothetical protein